MIVGQILSLGIADEIEYITNNFVVANRIKELTYPQILINRVETRDE
jgi:hypothetical protein